MSAPDRNEYANLIAAHANRDLTADERERLESLSATDRERTREIADVEFVHTLFDGERALSGEVAVPVNLAEEADEGYQRLQRVAARSEDLLRAHLKHPGVRVPESSDQVTDHRRPTQGRPTQCRPEQRRPMQRRRPMILVAAAVVIASLAFLYWPDSAPAMLTGNPDREVLGSANIHLDAELHADLPVLHWQPVLGADQYEAIILGVDGEELLRRPAESAATTRWELSTEQYAALATRRVDTALRLRIRALSGGREVGRSADLPLVLVD